MRELITVSAAFIIVTCLALFMYVGNQKHTSEVLKTKELNELVDRNHDELKTELDAIKAHMAQVDSIYHKKLSE